VPESALPAAARARFEVYAAHFGPPTAWKFTVDGMSVWVVMDGQEELFWNDLYDDAGNKLAHGYSGDSGPEITYWTPTPWDPSLQY
jgi:hypothetical protein